jgi:hypothetical protein
VEGQGEGVKGGGGGMRRKFSHFVDLKNMISAHAKDFCEKKWPYLLFLFLNRNYLLKNHVRCNLFI